VTTPIGWPFPLAAVLPPDRLGVPGAGHNDVSRAIATVPIPFGTGLFVEREGIALLHVVSVVGVNRPPVPSAAHGNDLGGGTR
jgi:hypothetical protein